MWAVYLCGCTDCFLHAMFMDKKEAEKWMAAKEKDRGHSVSTTDGEAPLLIFVKDPADIDRTDTGWQACV